MIKQIITLTDEEYVSIQKLSTKHELSINNELRRLLGFKYVNLKQEKLIEELADSIYNGK